MANDKGYYISGIGFGDQRVDVHLVYGAPSAGRTAIVSPVQAVERSFVLRRNFQTPNTISINQLSYASSAGNVSIANDPALQRVFDFYLLQWLLKRADCNFDNGLRFGIERVTGEGKREEVQKFLGQKEPLDVELPKVRVEGLDGILEQFAIPISPKDASPIGL